MGKVIKKKTTMNNKKKENKNKENNAKYEMKIVNKTIKSDRNLQ